MWIAVTTLENFMMILEAILTWIMCGNFIHKEGVHNLYHQ